MNYYTAPGIPRNLRPTDPLAYVLKGCADVFGVTVSEIQSRIRIEEIAYARHASVYILRNRYKMSVAEIGRKTKRHHTTIINSLNACKNIMPQDDLFKLRIKTLMNY